MCIQIVRTFRMRDMNDMEFISNRNIYMRTRKMRHVQDGMNVGVHISGIRSLKFMSRENSGLKRKQSYGKTTADKKILKIQLNKEQGRYSLYRVQRKYKKRKERYSPMDTEV